MRGSPAINVHLGFTTPNCGKVRPNSCRPLRARSCRSDKDAVWPNVPGASKKNPSSMRAQIPPDSRCSLRQQSKRAMAATQWADVNEPDSIDFGLSTPPRQSNSPTGYSAVPAFVRRLGPFRALAWCFWYASRFPKCEQRPSRICLNPARAD